MQDLPRLTKRGQIRCLGFGACSQPVEASCRHGWHINEAQRGPASSASVKSPGTPDLPLELPLFPQKHQHGQTTVEGAIATSVASTSLLGLNCQFNPSSADRGPTSSASVESLGRPGLLPEALLLPQANSRRAAAGFRNSLLSTVSVWATWGLMLPSSTAAARCQG